MTPIHFWLDSNFFPLIPKKIIFGLRPYLIRKNGSDSSSTMDQKFKKLITSGPRIFKKLDFFSKISDLIFPIFDPFRAKNQVAKLSLRNSIKFDFSEFEEKSLNPTFGEIYL